VAAATRLRLVFAGTPDFAVPGLRACIESGAEVVAVYTQPDRPAGRGRKLTGACTGTHGLYLRTVQYGLSSKLRDSSLERISAHTHHSDSG